VAWPLEEEHFFATSLSKDEGKYLTGAVLELLQVSGLRLIFLPKTFFFFVSLI